MRKLIVGVVIGLALGILATLAVQRARLALSDTDADRSVHLFQSAPLVLERALPGARVLDVALHTPSSHSVNYEHEALYDVHITYQRDGRIKRVILPFGFAKGTVIVPNSTDLVIADDKAEVIKTLGSGHEESK